MRPPDDTLASVAVVTFMPDLVLQLHDIDEFGKDYTFELKPSWLDQALIGSPLRRDPKRGAGQLRVHAQKNGNEVLVDGEADADLLVDCSRCLGDAALRIHAAITVLLSPAPSGTEAGLGADELDELDRGYFSGSELVLDELVREHLLLECPMQPLCSAQCGGIEVPPHVRPPAEDFGGAGEVDPRLLPLKQLRAKLSSKKE